LLFTFFLLFSVGVIIVFDVLWAPVPLPRYRMDFSWLISIAAFILIGVGAQGIKHDKIFHAILGATCILTLVSCLLLFLYPSDGNFVEYFNLCFFE